MRRATYPRGVVTVREACSVDATIDGREVAIVFDRVTSGGWEHYGADADGRPGELRWMVDDDSAEDVTVDDCLGDGPIPLAISPLRAQVEPLIADYLETQPPAAYDHLRDEPDPDRYRD